MKFTLDRDLIVPGATLGKLSTPDFGVFTLELPWKNNQPRVSCIPSGVYIVERDYYHHGGYEAFELRDVPDRSEIKIHIGNFPDDVLGCIVVGLGRDESKPMVTNSRKAYEKFMEYTKDVDRFELEIIG